MSAPDDHDPPAPRPLASGAADRGSPGLWSRRRLFAYGLSAAALSLASRLTPPPGARNLLRLAGQAPSPQGSAPFLIIKNPRALDAESPLTALRTRQTPDDLFFVRSHHGAPRALPERWTLTVGGEVERPFVAGIEELQRLDSVRRLVTIECSGNGRALFQLPSTSGIQWGYGAVSSAYWTGVPLSTLLERAAIKPTALHFWMEGADRPLLPATPPFLRSIPREVALGDALVAYEMNDRPIPLLNGGPLRLIVPAWYGMASTKWLTRIHARPVESDNYFMKTSYRYADGSPVAEKRVKSLVTSPLAGEQVAVGRLAVTGVAWTGIGVIQGVEVSGDGGRSWDTMQITTPREAGGWVLWEGETDVPAPGEQTVRARATESSGAVQPGAATPNPGGYGNNSIHVVGYRAVPR